MDRLTQLGVGILLIAVLAGLVTMLWALEPTTQPAAKDQPPAAGNDGQTTVNQPPLLRFLVWQVKKADGKTLDNAWMPNGEPVNDEFDPAILQPLILSATEMGDGSGENWRFLHLWFSHPDVDRSTRVNVTFMDASGKKIPGPGGVCSSYPRGMDRNKDETGWTVTVASPGRAKDNIPKTVDMVLTYGLEPWETIGTVNAVLEGPVTVGDYTVYETTEENDSFRFGDDKGRAVLRVSRVDVADPRTERDIIAVTLDGTELHYRGLTSDGKEVRYWYDTPRSEIKLFRFRTRQMREVTLKNISLQPGTITKPEAVDEAGNRTPLAGPKKEPAMPSTTPATKPAAK